MLGIKLESAVLPETFIAKMGTPLFLEKSLYSRLFVVKGHDFLNLKEIMAHDKVFL